MNEIDARVRCRGGGGGYLTYGLTSGAAGRKVMEQDPGCSGGKIAGAVASVLGGGIREGVPRGVALGGGVLEEDASACHPSTACEISRAVPNQHCNDA
jgi:hypothetical protein